MILSILVISAFALTGSGSNDIDDNVRGQPSARKTMEYITKFDNGQSEPELDFGSVGGTDNSLNVTFPKRAMVLGASLELEGLAMLNEKDYDFTDKVNNSAYEGDLTKLPPTGKPGDYDGAELDLKEYNAIDSKDSSLAEYTSTGTSNTTTYLYHLFKFTVSDGDISKLRFYWYGENWVSNWVTRLFTNEVSVYIYCVTNTTWVRIDFQTSTSTNGPTKITVNKEVSQAGNYVDSSDTSVNVMVAGPAIPAGMKGAIGTDYSKLTVFAGDAVYPSSVSLDAGNDGDSEWTKTGTFDTKVTIGDGAGLKTELQEHIDAAGTEEGELIVNFAFSTATGGRLQLTNLNISIEALEHNDAPETKTGVLTHFYMKEDDLTSGDDLVELADCFSDDHDSPETLRYAVAAQEDAAKLEARLDEDGHHLDFIPSQDFSGTLMFRVSALDLGADETADTFDDLLTVSHYFNVTVEPINDAPVITVANENMSINESETLKFHVQALDVDDDKFTWEVNNSLRATIVPDMLDTSKAEVIVVPVEKDTGRSILLMLTAKDFGGGQGDEYKANGQLEVKVDVININDPPKFVEFTVMPDIYTEPMIKNSVVKLNNGNAAVEDEEFKVLVKAEDPDLGIEPEEKLTYAVSALTTVEGSLDIDPETGELTLLPTNADVGTVSLTVSVTDWKDEKVEHDFEIEVKNRNDAPMNAVILQPTMRTFTTDDEIDFKGECHDDDLDITNSDEVLTFMWYTNRTAELLGMDSEIYAKKLAAGLHLITLKVIDTEGESAEATIELLVNPVDTGPGPDVKNDTDDKEEDDDKKSDTPTVGSQGDDKKGNTVFMALLIAIIVAVVIVLIIFGVVKPRKKKDEMADIENLQQQQQLPPIPQMPMQPYPGMYPMQYGMQTPYGMQPQMAGYPMGGQQFGMMQPGLPPVQAPVQPVTTAQLPVAEQVKVPGISKIPESKSVDPGAISVEAQEVSFDQLEDIQKSDLPSTKPIQ